MRRRAGLIFAHTIGSRERPLSDAGLDAEFHTLVDPVPGAARAVAPSAACRGIAAADDLHPLVAFARP